MSKYVVKTPTDRNIIIETDDFYLNRDNVFVFTDEDGDVVANVPNTSNVIAIVEEDADINDFYYSDHEGDDVFKANYPAAAPPDDETETDDVCLDCRLTEFLNSPEFFDKVDDIVSFWHEDANAQQEAPAPEVVPAETPAPKGVDNLTVYRAQNEQGQFFWGFNTPDGKFVPWPEECGFTRKNAEDGLTNYLSGVRGFYMIPVSDVTPIPEETK